METSSLLQRLLELLLGAREKKIPKKHFGTSDTSPLIVCKVRNCCVC